MADLNWCTFCDNAISPFSESLYCSEQCLRSDALRNHPLLGYTYPEFTDFPRASNRSHASALTQSPFSFPSSPLLSSTSATATATATAATTTTTTTTSSSSSPSLLPPSSPSSPSSASLASPKLSYSNCSSVASSPALTATSANEPSSLPKFSLLSSSSSIVTLPCHTLPPITTTATAKPMQFNYFSLFEAKTMH